MQAQGVAEERGHTLPDGVLRTAHGRELMAQSLCIPDGGQTAGAEFQHRSRHHSAVGQGQKAVAQVTHSGHGKGPPQGRGAAAGIKGGDQMYGIVGVGGEPAAQITQGCAAGKKHQAGAQGGKGRSRRVHAAPPSSACRPKDAREDGISPSSRMRKKINRPIQASVAA